MGVVIKSPPETTQLPTAHRHRIYVHFFIPWRLGLAMGLVLIKEI
jgi:hypothetical protein